MKKTYADFVLTTRAGKVIEPVDTFGFVPVGKLKRDKDWDLPSYDFGHLLDAGHPDYLGDRVCELMGELGATTAEELEAMGVDAGPGLHPEARVACYGVRGATTTQPCAFVYWKDGQRNILTHRPVGEQMIKGIITRSIRCENYRLFDDGVAGSRWILIKGQSASIQPIAAAASALLANPNVVFDSADFDASRAALNRHRKKHGKRLFPATRIVRLTKVVKLSEPDRPHQGGSHASPRPHDRAPDGYTRTYKKTGLTKWYPGPIKVRGGAEAAGAVEYEVRA